ncbi:globin [Paenibacillus sp. F411]|uniref:Globin, protozoan/cyanobacterial family n=1 Tax=Paenibacillus algicola TaxID=2565926 RepID=A0A4P8XQR4_9BACL|nr:MULTISPECIES: globin [Paenibacillus]MBO2943902.1 globin [Paenibacillus sp. F411]QCT04200.1 globin, protozoan/cyanobacterial family [Paenibacillus algicola]
MDPSLSLYDQLGGAEGVRALVEAFYPRVQQNAVLAPLFPEDIEPVMEKQYMFLSQFFGGPALFSEAFGHPMMRARHMKFTITDGHADEWLHCMAHALRDVGIQEPLASFVLDRLSGPARHFVNSY